MPRWICCLVLFSLVCSPARSEQDDSSRVISVETYRDKVRASLLGQIVGNIYGLGYEFKFIDEAGPDAMPYGYTPYVLNRLRELEGAFSDDDTDIEYMYLLQMERHGIEPTYAQLAEAWKRHVKARVWCANRVALNLMRAGYTPPLTGRKAYNDQWFQIDPQLVNEIWSITAPGMPRYATAKSEWAARITSDDFGLEPTVHYAAMYSAAFFESDPERLVEIGLESLPPQSRFAEAVRYVQQLVNEHPDDWRTARKNLAARYYGQFDYNQGAWPAIDAVLNGACGVMALLYGSGDFQRTLDISCALGFDADNQAATMAGLLGVAGGSEAIPDELLRPIADSGWRDPFNDRYVNVTREELPDASINDMAARLAAQGEKVILATGGQILEVDGVPHYQILADAEFTPPFELHRTPLLMAEVGRPLTHEFYTGRDATRVQWEIEGDQPEGLSLAEGVLSGVPTKHGESRFRLTATYEGQTRVAEVHVLARGENLAPTAARILYNPDTVDHDLSLIRDDERRSASYSSRADHERPKVDYYGYEWDTPQTISALRFAVGRPDEWGGWFTSLAVEHRTEEGEWLPVDGLQIAPELNLDNTQWLKASGLEYDLSFKPVQTTAIQIIGQAGGIDLDAANRHRGKRFYTTISELGAYEQ